MAAANRFPEVIDLVGSNSDDDDDVVPLPIPRNRMPVQMESDSEDEEDDPPLPMAGAFPAEVSPAAPANPVHATDLQERRVDGGTIFVVGGEEVFIPDEEPQRAPSVNPAAATTGSTIEEGSASDREFTIDACLHHVLEIFPDISHEHVRGLWNAFDAETNYEVLAGRARLDNIVEQLVSATSYPKEVKGKLKRKRVDSVEAPLDTKQWERADRAAVPGFAKGSIAAICKADFPAIPRNHISERLATHRYLFQTYVALAKDVDDNEEGARVFGRGRPSNTTTADADTIALNCGIVELVAELAAARLQVGALRAQREAEKAKKRAEEENLQRAVASGRTAECSACFDDLPMNRQIHCDGETAHFTCFECAETYIKTEVGDARCRVLCPAGCGVGFSHSQLHLLENKPLLEKLARIQQEQDIRDAGLEDLESCPFCDYKAIMPPVDEDFEFRCANPECEKISCRRCKAISHVPISCEQHAKDNKLSSRHQIEEAMTAALVRTCVKCKKQFIKESGCNKMSCGSCGTLQCYVCSAVIKDYNHFDQGAHRGRPLDGAQSKKCPLYDNVEERHEREVRAAEAKARAEVVENNPDVSEEDLEIKVSEAVKQAEMARIQRGGDGYGAAGYAFHAMLNGQVPRGHLLRLFDGDGRLDQPEDMEDLLEMLGGRPLGVRRAGEGAGAAVNRAEEARNRYQDFQEQHRLRREAREARQAGVNPERARFAELRPAHAPGIGGAAQGREGAAGAQNPFYRPGDNAQDRLQGYIPVVFPHDRHRPQAQPAQPPAQPPAALDHPNVDVWPEFFNGLFDFGDGAEAQPPHPAAQNPANDGGAFPRPYQPAAAHNHHHHNHNGDQHFGNPFMPGAYPGHAHSNDRGALQNAHQRADAMIAQQREQIAALRRRNMQERQRLEEQRQRARQQEVQQERQRVMARIAAREEQEQRRRRLQAVEQMRVHARFAERRPRGAHRYRPGMDD